MSIFVFDDQKKFMQLGGQTTDRYNREQVDLYTQLVGEEAGQELSEAMLQLVRRGPSPEAVAAVADAALDIIVVAIGLLYSLGLKPQPLWNEVKRSNMSKVNPTTGRVEKRADGKILKPATFSPPDLLSLVRAQLSNRGSHETDS